MTDLFDHGADDADDAEHAVEVVDRPPRRMRRWLTILMAVAAAGALVLAVAGFWVYRQMNPSGGPGEEVVLAIPAGTSTRAIAQLLEDEDIITNATIFRAYLKVRGGAPFQAGRYRLRENSSMEDVRAALSRGPEIVYERLTIPEGLRLEAIADRVDGLERLSGERFLELAKTAAVRSDYQPGDVETLEGLLFPDTYQVAENEDEQVLLRRMVATFDSVAAELGYDEAAERVGVQPYQAVIVASLVEAEAKVPEDRAKIARVIYNRLQKGMPLQIDATVIYALGRHPKDGRVLYRDLEVDSPYNTYKATGLPPTPIMVPGRAALEAALHPADGDWLFYVKYEKNGAHAFSVTSEEHAQRVREARAKGVLP